MENSGSAFPDNFSLPEGKIVIDSDGNIQFASEQSSPVIIDIVDDGITEELPIIPAEAAPEEPIQEKSSTVSRRRLVQLAIGAGVAAAIKVSYELGQDQRDREITPPRTYSVTAEDAAMAAADYEKALVTIFRVVYTNALVTKEEIITYMMNGGVVNETALEEERQTDSLEAGDQLLMPFPPNFKG